MDIDAFVTGVQLLDKRGEQLAVKLDRVIELLEALLEIEKHDHEKKENWAMPR